MRFEPSSTEGPGKADLSRIQTKWVASVGESNPLKRGEEMDAIQEAFTAGIMLTVLTWGTLKIVIKNIREEWNQ